MPIRFGRLTSFRSASGYRYFFTEPEIFHMLVVRGLLEALACAVHSVVMGQLGGLFELSRDFGLGLGLNPY